MPAFVPLKTVVVLCGVALAGLAWAAEATITPQGLELARRLDAMGVEEKWPAGVHVNWESGIPDGKPVSSTGRHTHCSAFVASAAKSLGVYILRPPEHRQELLANAQNEWLFIDGAARGWRPLMEATEAQEAANHGELVVATYHNHHDDKPGHIAIVRPSTKSVQALVSEGPDIIQVGAVNKTRTTLKEGFAGHPAAWKNNEVEYYAHKLALLP